MAFQTFEELGSRLSYSPPHEGRQARHAAATEALHSSICDTAR